MKLSDFMAARAARASLGEQQADDYVLAVDCSENGNETDVGDYAIATVHTENLGAAVSANTTDKNYLYEGATTLRSSPRRNFTVAGQRFGGDDFQDFALSHDVVFGVGSAVVRSYVYFNCNSNKGEKGTLTINVTNDGGAASGNAADFSVAMASVGTPAEYTWVPKIVPPSGT